MKKIIYFIILLVSFFIVNTDAYALETLSIDDNDYELVCIYEDGAELIISKNGIYLSNNSLEISSSSESNIKLFLTEDQIEYDSNGNLIATHYDELTSNGGCPRTLYVYSVPAQYDSTATEEEQEAEADIYYYATKSGIAEQIAGTHKNKKWWLPSIWESDVSNAVEIDNADARLISEEAYLISSKTALICDYESIKNEATSSSQAVSLYLYDNITFLERGTRLTPLSSNSFSDNADSNFVGPVLTTPLSSCPSADEIYINNPEPKSIADDGSSIRFYYNAVQFGGFYTSASCEVANAGEGCQKFQYIGSRNGTPDANNNTDVCTLVGNRTIVLLRDVLKVLQIVVPALVLILIALDITKMVLAGNIDEELPKKKKSIIIRLIIMVFFFFIPLIAGLLIQLINDAGIGIQIGDIECFFR